MLYHIVTKYFYVNSTSDYQKISLILSTMVLIVDSFRLNLEYP